MLDVLIPLANKDLPNIGTVIDCARRNVLDGIADIYVVSPERLTINEPRVTVLRDCDVLSVEVARLRYRPTWVFQQLIKLLQTVTRDQYLVLDADTYLLRPVRFVDAGRLTHYLGREQCHDPYFTFLGHLGLRRWYPHSFIADFMVFDRRYVTDMLGDRDRFLALCYERISPTCYPSEYEMFGQYCFRHAFNVPMQMTKYDGGTDGSISPDTVAAHLRALEKEYTAASLHMWR